MNKKGFTIIELMTTFVLVAIISTLLIKLVVTLKEVYINGDMKTTLITKQSTMTDKIYKDLDNNNLTKIESCGETNCVNFVYTTGSKKFIIDKNKKTMTYDNYTIKLGKEGSFGDVSFEKFNSDLGSIISLKAPIKNRLLKGDYGLNITYQLDDDIEFDNSIAFDVKNTGTTVEFDENMNLIYGLYNIGETNAGYMKYSINNEIVTVTSLRNDGYGITTGRADLEAGKTYVFSCNTDAPNFKYSASDDTVQAYFLLDGEYTTYYGMKSKDNFEFTPEASGTYWLRLDVDKINTTHKFWDISVKEKKTNKTKQVTLGEKYGNFPIPEREGYEFLGWSLVPSEYQQVEYIEATGTQYIDLGYIVKPNTGVETTFKFNDLTTQQRVYGVNANTTVNYLNYQLYINGSTKLGYAFIDGVGNWINTEVDIDTNIHKWQFNVKDNKWKVDNISGNIADSARTKNSRYNIFLFAYNTVSNNPTNYAKVRIYSFKIYEDGKVVRNYIPVYRKSDNVIGLYEIIEGKFYTNAGTGTFNKGPNGSINDEGIIDSSTKVTLNANHTLKGIWKRKESTFVTGPDFVKKIKQLANPSDTVSSSAYNDTNIVSIKRSKKLTITPTSSNIVSTSDSYYPIYVWFDNGTIYYYTEAVYIYVNNYAESMFRSLKSLTNLDISSFDTSRTTSLNSLFKNTTSLTSVDLTNFDTSNVVDMMDLFAGWDNVNNASTYMSIKEIKGIDKLDTSKVTNMQGIFCRCNQLTSVNLSNFNTSKVTNISQMFNGASALTSLDISSFDMSKVTNSGSMLLNTTSLTTFKTPKNYPTDSSVTITLPATFKDSSNNTYTSLNSSSPTSTTLTKQ